MALARPIRARPPASLSTALVLGALSCACGPSGDGFVRVTLGATPRVSGVHAVRGTVTVAGVTRPLSYDAEVLGGRSIPPTTTLGVAVPVTLGSRATLHLEAIDRYGAVLGSADGDTKVDGGRASEVTLTLLPPKDCGPSARACPSGSKCLAGQCVTCTPGLRLGGTAPIAVNRGPLGIAISDDYGLGRPSIAIGSAEGRFPVVLSNDLRGGFGSVDAEGSGRDMFGPTTDVVVSGNRLRKAQFYARKAQGGGVYKNIRENHAEVLATSPGSGLASDDMDGDGANDLIVGAGDGIEVVYLTIATTRVEATSPRWPAVAGEGEVAALAVGDLDGDGVRDIAATMTGAGRGRLSIWRASGGRGAYTPSTLPCSETGACGAVAIADLDGDGRLDLIAGDVAARSIHVWRGGAGLPSGEPMTIGGLPAGPVALVAADLDGDGRLDVAAALEKEAIAVLHGSGDGKLASPVLYSAGGAPRALAAGDLDGDGRVDLAVTDTATSTVGVFYQRADGTLIAGQPVFAETPSFPYGIVPADLDHDGWTDLAFTSGSTQAGVLRNDGRGRFEAARFDRAGGNTAAFPGVGDLDGDGFDDLVVPAYWSAVIYVFVSRGGRALTLRDTIAADLGPIEVVTADFNGDGHNDAAVASNAKTVWVYPGQGDGSLGTPVRTKLPGAASSLERADLDGDGRLDLVVGSAGAALWVLMGIGDGTFATPVAYETGKGPVHTRLADLNGDGKLDIVATCMGTDLLDVFLGQGGAAFVNVAHVATGQRPATLDVGDVDGDGRLDVITGNLASMDLSVLLGDGAGGFAEAIPLPIAAASPTRVALADFNRDGRLDVAVTNRAEAGGVTVLGNEPGERCVVVP